MIIDLRPRRKPKPIKANKKLTELWELKLRTSARGKKKSRYNKPDLITYYPNRKKHEKKEV